MNETTTWRAEITQAMARNDDSWDRVTFANANAAGTGKTVDALLDHPFDPSFGLPQGPDFIVYTHDWIYFPGEYDGSEFVTWVRRNPDPRWLVGHPTEFGGTDG